MSLVIALFMGAEKSGTEYSSILDPPDLFPFYVCAKIWGTEYRSIRDRALHNPF